jgi:sporulation protein YlmC with PRC-barrel domain
MGQMTANRLEAYMPMGDLEDKRDFSFTDIRGYKVLNTTGHKVGTVKEIFVDPNTLEPKFALLDYEKFMNFNTKSLLVAWNEVHVGDDYVQTRPSEEAPTAQNEADEGRMVPDFHDTAMPTTTANILASHGGGIQTSREMSPDRDMSPGEPVDYDDHDVGDREEGTVTSAGV